MKILFLDVDHVLNTRVGSLDGDKLDLLRTIVEHTGCKIVISSTCRKSGAKMTQLREAMFYHGIRPGTVIGETPDLSQGIDFSVLLVAVPRFQEIRGFLKSFPHEIYAKAIVDDDTEADTGTGDYFRTMEGIGLTYSLSQDIIHHLNR